MNRKLPALFLLLGLISVRGQPTAPRRPSSQTATNKAPKTVKAAEDLGKIKIEAEKGNVSAQIKLADAFLSHRRPADALRWYQTAAINKSAEGMLQCGKLLMAGSKATAKDQEVPARPQDGIVWIYSAATNGLPAAWREIARAKQTGKGCSTNLVEAYAWWILLSDSGNSTARGEMNDLVLKLPGSDIVAGKALVSEMKSGHWPPLSVKKEAGPRAVLTLNGVSLGGPRHFAIINGNTFEENETGVVRVKQDKVEITCLKIMENSALIRLAGEDEPRLLKLE